MVASADAPAQLVEPSIEVAPGIEDIEAALDGAVAVDPSAKSFRKAAISASKVAARASRSAWHFRKAAEYPARYPRRINVSSFRDISYLHG